MWCVAACGAWGAWEGMDQGQMPWGRAMAVCTVVEMSTRHPQLCMCCCPHAAPTLLPPRCPLRGAGALLHVPRLPSPCNPCNQPPAPTLPCSSLTQVRCSSSFEFLAALCTLRPLLDQLASAPGGLACLLIDNVAAYHYLDRVARGPPAGELQSSRWGEFGCNLAGWAEQGGWEQWSLTCRCEGAVGLLDLSSTHNRQHPPQCFIFVSACVPYLNLPTAPLQVVAVQGTAAVQHPLTCHVRAPRLLCSGCILLWQLSCGACSSGTACPSLLPSTRC